MPEVIRLTGEEARKAQAEIDAYVLERMESIALRGGKSAEGVIYSETGKPRGLDEQD